jgi:exopolysaccharide biosynthesis protein
MKKLSVLLLASVLVIQSTFTATATYASTYGSLTSETKKEVSPNVTHIQSTYKSNSTPQSVNILDINLNSYTNVEIGLPTSLKSLARTSVTAGRHSYEGHRVVGAINASYFYNGVPSSLIAINNEVINRGALGQNTESPTQQAVAFGVTKDGLGLADYFTPQYVFHAGGESVVIDAVDATRGTGKAILYTNKNSTTGTNEWGVEIAVEAASTGIHDFSVGQVISGKVKSITKYQEPGNSTVPSNGFVISMNGKEYAEKFANVQIGEWITMDSNFAPQWQDAQFILAAGPLLVKDGKRNISMPTSTSFSSGSNPRTAVGVDRTGKRIFFVTIDGRQSGYSVGTSLTKLADYMISLGAVSAVNLDGGGSTTMAVRQLGTNTLSVVNKPSDGSERAVSAILQVVNTAAAGQVKAMTITGVPTQIVKGTTFNVSVKNAYDEFFNPATVDPSLVKWSVEGDIGTINGQTFTATKPGKGKIIGTYEQASVAIDVNVIDLAGKPQLISGFEDLSKWKISSDRATASAALNKAYAREGSHAVALSYDFTNGEAGTKTANIIAATTHEILGVPDHIGVWVNGDGNKNWLRAKLVDGTNTTYTLDFTEQSKFNWSGWKYVTAKLPEDIKAPIKFERLYIASPVASEQAKGTVYIDQLQAVYDANYVEPIYTDVAKTNWANEAISILNNRALIKGYTDGTYKPSKPITRAEVAVILARHLNVSAKKETDFNDVAKTYYAYDAIQAIAERGIITGRKEGVFAPTGQLTRAEMAVIIQRMEDLNGTKETVFSDLKVKHWAYKGIQAIVEKGYAKGYPDGTFQPDKSITRAEFASILSKVIQ